MAGSALHKTTLVTIVSVLLLGAPATAVDLSGEYRFDWTDGPLMDVCTVTIVQTGSSMTFDASCVGGLFLAGTGPIDTVTGDFSLTGTCDAAGPPAGPLSMTGTGAADSLSFTMSGTCQGFPAEYFGTKCGNGILDAGEVCEDGNRENGDCCSTSCAAETGNVCDAATPICTLATCDSSGACIAAAVNEPGGAPCDLDGDLCTEDLCDGAGTCVATSNPITCELCEVCDSASGCVGDRSTVTSHPDPGECRLLAEEKDSAGFRNDLTNDSKDLLRWKWTKGPGMPTSDFGSPTTTTDYTFCAFDTHDDRVLAAFEIPAGSDWSANSRGFTHKSRVPGVGKISVKLKAHPTQNRSKITLRAKGPTVGFPASFDVNGPLMNRSQLELRASNGNCWATRNLRVRDTDLSATTQKVKLKR